MLPPDLPHSYPGAALHCLDRSSADFTRVTGLSGTSRNRAEERVVEAPLNETSFASSVHLQVISSILTRQGFRNEALLRHHYEVEGLSARQISVLTGCSHSTINDALERYGIEVRPHRGGHLPYGFRRYGLKVFPHPVQQRTLQLVELRMKDGWSNARISAWLNSSKIKSPTGKGRWYGATVKRVIRNARLYIHQS